ncbi:hypothetical protein Gotri_010980 [Gossypium trilobum]|uniref:Uncharacterized protein n=1 Tax=Gossypium trilobum TaxID=34281 RepID=A0A7J9ES71_9ROSI|nr:hypothetical protein [Gossypium trilobum]
MASTTATTKCTITNGAGQNLVLALSNYEPAAGTINNTDTATFRQTMPAIYLNGALVYEVGRSLKWMIFWTTDNQVSSVMFNIDESIDWNRVVNNLTHGRSEYRITDTAGSNYIAWASIEPNSEGQELTANICAAVPT